MFTFNNVKLVNSQVNLGTILKINFLCIHLLNNSAFDVGKKVDYRFPRTFRTSVVFNSSCIIFVRPMLFCKHYKQPTQRDKSMVKIMCILRDLHVTIPEQYKKLKKKPNAAKILNLKKKILISNYYPRQIWKNLTCIKAIDFNSIVEIGLSEGKLTQTYKQSKFIF